MIRNWLQNFMLGRYGPDELGKTLLGASLLVMVISMFWSITWLVYLGYFLFFAALFRFCSKNFSRRRAENDRFIGYWWPVRTRVSDFLKRLFGTKGYRYYRCPSCKNMLRVPKNKGRVQITCPKCGERFIKKT